MRDELRTAPGKDGRAARKEYEKPAVMLERLIEALTGTCEPLGMDTGMDKLSFDMGSGVCRNPVT